MDPKAKKDFYILFITRSLRLFSYGSLAVVLFLYLNEIGFSESQIGLLMSLILLGDLVITMYLTTHADRFGRKKTLAIGALLKLFTGVSFALTTNYTMLVFSGIIGVISTSGGEIGPFLAIEQAALTDLKENISHGQIATLFGWYNLFGYLSQALGALFAGLITSYLQNSLAYTKAESYRVIMYTYAFWGLAKWLLYSELSENIQSKSHKEKKTDDQSICWGIKRKKTLKTLVSLSLLFALDAFAGGFVMQTFLSYWFNKKWNLDMSKLGGMLMITNIISGVSGLVASKLVSMIGAVQTMVLTHLPSNFLLMLIPVMPTQITSVLMLFGRSSISQMDVPARQAYVATVVESDERSAAGGITNIARSLGLLTAPVFLGYLAEAPVDDMLFSAPFFIAGGLKVVYDVAVGLCYITSKKSDEGAMTLKEPEEKKSLKDGDKAELIDEIEQAIADDKPRTVPNRPH